MVLKKQKIQPKPEQEDIFTDFHMSDKRVPSICKPIQIPIAAACILVDGKIAGKHIYYNRKLFIEKLVTSPW
ncbi:MAG: hypothetical protein JSW28_06300 [Thermoplasmata archaeon]|nr:MAG: hypothetical protein JSW28_06300 [Thermoplasmata archaeon]